MKSKTGSDYPEERRDEIAMPAAPNQSGERLTEESYWDSIYSKGATVKKTQTGKSVLERVLGQKWAQVTRNYSEYLFWNTVIGKTLPTDSNLKLVEIGSAPGHYLVDFNRRKHYQVFGIEYTHHGLMANREVFKRHGLDEENIIHGDMFDSELQAKYHEYFDIVYSGGLIEHFTNVDDVVNRHLNLLKPGGLLVVTIPNLRHVNYRLSKFFNESSISIHNIEIMDLDKFLEIFKDKNLTTIQAGYYGTFNVGLFNASNKLKRFALRGLQLVARPALNLLFYSLFKDKGRESKQFSPYIFYIGKKQ